MRDVTLVLLKCILLCTEEVIFINNKMDMGWIVLCLMSYKKRPTLYFICHYCFSFLKQCSIVFHLKKKSGSMNRRILYYYVPAKFQSLFSFSCSQRAHNLLRTIRQATKLHCCSANKAVFLELLWSLLSVAAAPEGSLEKSIKVGPEKQEMWLVKK